MGILTRGLKIGSVFSILSDRENNYIGHLLAVPERMGPVVQVYEAGQVDPFHCEQLKNFSRPFGPVIVGINPMIRSKKWRVIGFCEPPVDTNPQFLYTMRWAKGLIPKWYLVDTRGNETELGNVVPPNLRQLELFAGISGERLENRLLTGLNPFCYDEIMRVVAGGAPLDPLEEVADTRIL